MSADSVTAHRSDLPVANQRTVWALAWPIILSNITVPLLGLTDTAILGHLDDVTPLAAVAIGAQLFTLLLWSFGFLRMGTTALTSQELGRAGNNATLRILQQSVWLVLPVTLLSVTLALTLTPLLLPLYGSDVAVQQMAADYLHIRFWGIPLTLLQYCLIGWFIGRGETRIPMLMLITANVFNAGLDYLFVWHFHMAAEGVALGTLLADSAALALGLWAAFRRGLTLTLPRPDRAVMKVMLGINSDLFIRTLCLLSVFACFTALGAHMSTELLAANAVFISLLLLISNALDGFAHAAESLTGRYIGAGIHQALRRILLLTGVNSLGVALLLALSLITAGDLIFRLLTDNPDVLPLLQEMQVWLWLLPLTGVASYWLDGVMIGAHASRAMRNSMLFAAFFVFAPLAALPFATETFAPESFAIAIPLEPHHSLWLSFHLFLLARALLLLPTFMHLWRSPGRFLRGELQ